MAASTQAGPCDAATSSSSHGSLARSNDPEKLHYGHKPVRQRAPRSLPPWIDSYEERFGPVSDDQLQLLHAPAPSVHPRHITTTEDTQRRVSKDGFVWDDPQLGPAQGARAKIPHFLRYGRASMRGRKWDHLRTAEPVIVPGLKPSSKPQPANNWHDFIRSSAWGHAANEDARVVDHSVLEKLQPDFDRPADLTLTPARLRSSRRKRTKAFYERVWIFVMRHSLSPLLFRLGVMVTSILALGISARIYELTNSADNDSAERTQSIVSVAVDSVAVPYIAYMIWDEYTGKPIGLRSAVSKMSLILLDLFFVIFKSASTALAFESVVYHSLRKHNVREYSKVLAAFQLIGLISWSMTFTVNIFRMVEKLGGGDDEGSRI